MRVCKQSTSENCHCIGYATGVSLDSQIRKVLPTRNAKCNSANAVQEVPNGRPTPHVKPSSPLSALSSLSSNSNTLAELSQGLDHCNQLPNNYECYLNNPPADNRRIALMERGLVVYVKTVCGVLCPKMVSVLQSLRSTKSQLVSLQWPALTAIINNLQDGARSVESMHNASNKLLLLAIVPVRYADISSVAWPSWVSSKRFVFGWC
jgi:hypothetical protein